MDFIFQGFQSTLPVWLYVLIFAACLFCAWWSYHGITGIRPTYRYLLTGLRSAVFFILLMLLLNPFFKKETPHLTKPNIVIILDNSASVAVEKINYQGIKSYQQVLNELNFKDSSAINFNFFAVGAELEPTTINNLTFDADQTNLFNAIQLLKENSTGAKAAVIISDGIYTQGENPVFDAAGINVPVFTIGLGDTTVQKDVLVKSITTNSTGYLHNRQSVNVTVLSKGFKGQPIQVRLQKDEEIIASKTVTPRISNSSQNIVFELPLEEEGLRQFQVIIPSLSGEWTFANNSQRFAVNILDAKQQILSIAFEVHPDVGFIRSLLLSDQRIHLSNRTWLHGNRFIEGMLSVDPDTIDLAIIHGYPRSGLSEDIEQFLKKLVENVPLIIAATPGFSAMSFEREITSLPVSASAPWQYSLVSIQPAVDNHSILELPPVSYSQLPHLFSPIQNLTVSPGAGIIFSSYFQGQNTSKPALTVQQIGNRRIALFPSYGWFRIGQTSDSQQRKFVRQLWLNVVNWAATDPDEQKLEVRPTQTTFSETEEVIINAYLKNERGEAESQAIIDISIAADSAKAIFYSMENVGSGEYRVNLGSMHEGVYSFEAVAKKGTRTLGTQSGEFAVARSKAELVNTERNEQLLRQLAARTGGGYMPFDSLSTFWERLDERGILDQIEEIETTFWYPYQHLFWFILVVILLSTEWIFRKFLSLP